eukprot:scaffold180264_cov18-Tisochrysis_lutea.AAC.2
METALSTAGCHDWDRVCLGRLPADSGVTGKHERDMQAAYSIYRVHARTCQTLHGNTFSRAYGGPQSAVPFQMGHQGDTAEWCLHQRMRSPLPPCPGLTCQSWR